MEDGHAALGILMAVLDWRLAPVGIPLEANELLGDEGIEIEWRGRPAGIHDMSVDVHHGVAGPLHTLRGFGGIGDVVQALATQALVRRRLRRGRRPWILSAA